MKQHRLHGRTLTLSHGFTLIEVMVAAAILAILAAVAIPSYTQYLIRGRLVEAQGQLAGWGTGLQQYYQDNRSWVSACGGNGLGAIPANSAYFTFACPSHTANAFSITATGNSGTNVSGFVFTLDQNGNRVTTAAPAGWQTNASCWVRNQSGGC